MKNFDSYTNEELQKKCKNNFDLANAAIKLAKNNIALGRENTLKGIIDQLLEFDIIDVTQIQEIEKKPEEEDNY